MAERFRDFDFRWQEFEDALEVLSPEEQEDVLSRCSKLANQFRLPCPCESGKSFGECHGSPESETAWEKLGRV